MTTEPAGDSDRPLHYEIRVQGRLAPRWTTRFAAMTLTADGDGTSIFRGALPDQAALHGVLAGLRDLGIPLISVSRTRADDPTAAGSSTSAVPTAEDATS